MSPAAPIAAVCLGCDKATESLIHLQPWLHCTAPCRVVLVYPIATPIVYTQTHRYITVAALQMACLRQQWRAFDTRTAPHVGVRPRASMATRRALHSRPGR